MSGPAGSPHNLSFSRVILTGFMGAGKTTAGRMLAERLGWDFADSDALVEARAAMRVAEIFAHEGEEAFREMEGAAVQEACGRERLVLALGGGALERAASRAFLRGLTGTMVVYLEAPLEVLVARCGAHADGPVRPVLADRARLEERWKTRLPWYREAHLTVDTVGVAPETVVERILTGLEAADRERMRDRGERGPSKGRQGARA